MKCKYDGIDKINMRAHICTRPMDKKCIFPSNLVGGKTYNGVYSPCIVPNIIKPKPRVVKVRAWAYSTRVNGKDYITTTSWKNTSAQFPVTILIEKKYIKG